MNRTEVKKFLDEAKRCFLDNDNDLLSVEANERSITHKFAEYLQNILGSSWNVDCEYNRYGQNGKKIIEEIEQIVGRDTTTSKIKIHTVYPDIIIHKRGAKGPNLLVIEAKKDATDKERQTDKKKMGYIRKKFRYEFAVFLDFKTIKGQEDIKIEFLRKSS